MQVFPTLQKWWVTGMGRDFSSALQDGTRMGLDFLDPPRHALH